MNERELARAERHENINMLTELRIRLREYYRRIDDRRNKQAAKEAAFAALSAARTKMTRGKLVWKIILWSLIAIVATVLAASDFEGLWPVAVIGIGLAALRIVMSVKKYQRCTREFIELLAALREKLAAASAAYDEACTAVKDYQEWTLNPYIKEIVPERFCEVYVMDLHAVEQMLTLLIQLRADSIKEVINLYEQLKYQNNMINSLSYVMNKVDSIARSSARSAAASERTAVASERTAVASERTAAATEVTAVNTASIAASERRQTRAMEDLASSGRRMAAAEERSASASESVANSINN